MNRENPILDGILHYLEEDDKFLKKMAIKYCEKHNLLLFDMNISIGQNFSEERLSQSRPSIYGKSNDKSTGGTGGTGDEEE